MISPRHEERLRAEERHQLLDELVEASPAGVVVCDFDGNVERMNPAATRLLAGAGNDLLALHASTSWATS